jgi:two-component system LytT family response regulator
MLKAILVDDENAALRSLELLIGEYCKDVQVIGKAKSASEGLDLIAQLNPDIVFLDIEMPQGTGFELIEQSPEINFQVIFVTAFNHYAVKAFKYSAIDYILKPVDIDELIVAVEKVRELRKLKVNPRERYSVLFENIREVLPRKLVIPMGSTYSYIDLLDVLYVSKHKNEFTFSMLDGSTTVCRCETLDIPDVLTDRGFHYVSPNCLVNLNRVQKVDKAAKGRVILENGFALPLDSISKDEFIDKLLLFNQERKL